MFCFFWRIPWGILLKLRQISIHKYIHLQSPWKLELLANSGSEQQNVFPRFTWREKNIVNMQRKVYVEFQGLMCYPLGAYISMHQKDCCFMPSQLAAPSKGSKPKKRDDHKNDYHLQKRLAGAGPVLGAFLILSHVIPSSTLGSRHSPPHFTEEEVEAQRCQGAPLRSHS